MTERDLVSPLQAAIKRADSTWVSQPSHLRRRLEEELGVDARRHRAQVHQLVVAAEERIPIRLKRNGWSPTEREELGHRLVVTRGWTPEASDWAVATWAAALGLTDERPAAPSPTARPRSESPDERFATPTAVPSERFVAPTDVPPDRPVEATELPDELVPAPTPSPRAPDRVERGRSSTAGDLPTRGTRNCTRKASAFLGQELDVAYEVKAGPSPALLLLAVPIGLAAFVLPALSGVLLMAFVLIIAAGRALWPARILAIKGHDVWLLAKKRGLGVKPTALLAQETRDGVAFAGGWPFPSVRVAGQRLWFQFPITKAARRLPTKVEEAHQ